MQRAPQPFTAAVPIVSGDHQAVRVVHFRAKVSRTGLVLPKQEHACQRCQAQHGQRLVSACQRVGAHEHLGLNLGGGLLARGDVKAVSACQAGRVHQRVNSQHLAVSSRLDKPEFSEAGKFFARAAHCVNSHTTCRQAVALAAAEGAKVAGALKYCQLVLVGG